MEPLCPRSCCDDVDAAAQSAAVGRSPPSASTARSPPQWAASRSSPACAPPARPRPRSRPPPPLPPPAARPQPSSLREPQSLPHSSSSKHVQARPTNRAIAASRRAATGTCLTTRYMAHCRWSSPRLGELPPIARPARNEPSGPRPAAAATERSGPPEAHPRRRAGWQQPHSAVAGRQQPRGDHPLASGGHGVAAAAVAATE